MWMYFARGSPARPSREAKRAEDSPQTKAPPPRLIFTSKSKPDPEDVLAEEARFPRLLDRERDVLHRQGVLVPDVDVALAGADRVGADDHPLEDAVGVALQEAPVHVGAGVALVGVADDVLGLALGLPAWSPTSSRWGSRRRRGPGGSP